jgi:hypothetical protein
MVSDGESAKPVLLRSVSNMRVVRSSQFCTLIIIDDYNRVGLYIDVSFSTPASRVIRVLERPRQTLVAKNE